MRKEEVQLFLTFFFLYALFAHVAGWNEQSRMLAAIALVDTHSLSIDSYANLTGDRITYDGHYYSDKAPGMSLLLTPIYTFAKIGTSDAYRPDGEMKILIPQQQFNTTIYYDAQPGSAFLLTALLGTVLLAALPGALIICLLFRMVYTATKDRNVAFITAALLGIGTLLFSYSTVLVGSTLSVLFALFPFHLIFIKKSERPRDLLLSGLLLGAAIVFDYLMLVYAVVFLIFVFLRKRMENRRFLLMGIGIGVLPLFVYNILIFHNPFALSINYPDPRIFPCAYGKTYSDMCFDRPFFSERNIPLLAFSLLFKPYRGFFFFAPMLLFALLGFWYYYRKNREIAHFIVAAAIVFVALNASYIHWTSGNSFGPRYLLILVPLLSLPLAYFIKENKSVNLKILFLFLTAISIFHTLLSTTGFWEGVGLHITDTIMLKAGWYGGTFLTNSTENLNPLYQHYLPMFLDSGPRSRLFEDIIIGEFPDIRDKPLQIENLNLFTVHPWGILSIQMSFLVIPFVLGAALIVWRERFGNKVIIAALFVGLIFLSRLTFSDVVFDKGFYPRIKETLRWFGNEAKIYYYSPSGGTSLVNISLEGYRFNKNRGLTVNLNGEPIGSFYADSVLEPMRLKKGENELQFISHDACDYPFRIEKNSSEFRCINFALKAINVVSSDDFKNITIAPFFGSGWYNKESDSAGVSSGNSTIFVYSNETRSVFLLISLRPYKVKELELVVNGRKINTYVQPHQIFENVYLEKGFNQITFSSSSCDTPALLENNSDFRCIGFVLHEIRIFPKLPSDMIFGSGWYDWEVEQTTGRMMRFASNKSVIYLNAHAKEEVLLNLTISPYKMHYVSLSLNGADKGLYAQPPYTVKRIILQEGLNTLNFIADGCDIPSVNEKNNDYRCLGFSVYNLSLISGASNYTFVFGSGWYDWETEQTTGRMMRFAGENATVFIFSNISKPVFLTVIVQPYKFRDVQLTVNNKTVGQYVQPRTIMEKITLDEGINELKFQSTGCNNTSELADSRCLSFALFTITVTSKLPERIVFGSGWYDWEVEQTTGEQMRFAGNESVVYVYAEKPEKMLLNLTILPYKARTVSLYFNGESIGTYAKISSVTELLELEEGINVFHFQTFGGCEISALTESIPDYRCLGFSVKGFRLLSPKGIP